MGAPLTFVDLYAGCGGLSLGLMKAGWRGLFAIEKEKNAFTTLSHNLINSGRKELNFQWPSWLPKQATSLEDLLSKYQANLKALTGHVTLLVGGPPCQGFSTLGGRSEKDPRNQAFRRYLEVVSLLKPDLVLMENVHGIALPFSRSKQKRNRKRASRTYAQRIESVLEKAKYDVWSDLIVCRDFGVPQRRPRFIIVGRRKTLGKDGAVSPFALLTEDQENFLRARNLRVPVSAKQALGDLETSGKTLFPCPDSIGFLSVNYRSSRSNYQKLMHGQLNGAVADSHRLVNHRPETVKKFRWFLNECPKGKILSPSERGKYKNNKHTVYVLSPTTPAPTVTTLPDDILHYSEPRILTVREMARLQSFPDWFQFRGKYTTGSEMRTRECPRYTQVGNAVPPLLAEALGLALTRLLNANHAQRFRP